VLLLPVDPDASARALCSALRAATGLNLGVLITDTVGRPWRDGQTDIAIGAAGVAVLDDLRGTLDAQGRRLDVTLAAVADEIAGAADLIKGKTSGNPVAVVRGLGHLVVPIDAADRGARRLLRDSASDMFRVGSAEAYAEGYAAGMAAGAVAGAAAGEASTAPAVDASAAASPPTTQAADDGSADMPQGSPSSRPKGENAASREILPHELPQGATSAPAKGQDAATRDTRAADAPAELPVAAPSQRSNGPQVATREDSAGELPVGAPSERSNGPQEARRGSASA
jgi:coenzyme F420-0:L-glutamate ligase/coenzyme F420-1:gamma-L-glutamate ligase